MAVNYQVLRDVAIAAVNATRASRDQRRAALAADWQLQTSNSYRRIGAHGDGDVLCATTHPIDHHPDLLAKREVLAYVVAAQPSVVLELLDDLDLRHRSEESWNEEAERHERDHRAHYAEREALRAALHEVLEIAERLAHSPSTRERIIELRRRYEEGTL